jgi:hypothetical protein
VTVHHVWPMSLSQWLLSCCHPAPLSTHCTGPRLPSLGVRCEVPAPISALAVFTVLSLSVYKCSVFFYLFICSFIFWQYWYLNSGSQTHNAILCHLSHDSSAFCSGYLEIGSHFLPRLAWSKIFSFMFPTIAGITGTHHHAQVLVEMGSFELFSQAGLKL